MNFQLKPNKVRDMDPQTKPSFLPWLVKRENSLSTMDNRISMVKVFSSSKVRNISWALWARSDIESSFSVILQVRFQVPLIASFPFSLPFACSFLLMQSVFPKPEPRWEGSHGILGGFLSYRPEGKRCVGFFSTIFPPRRSLAGGPRSLYSKRI